MDLNLFKSLGTLATIAFILFWIIHTNDLLLIMIYALFLLFYVISLKYSFIPKQEHVKLLGVLILSTLIRTVSIRDTPSPLIDVYYLSTQGFECFLKGTNPYTTTYIAPPEVLWPYGSQNVQGYPPLMLLMLGPGYFLSDIRYSILIADLIVILILYRLTEQDYGYLFAVLLGLNPFSGIIIRSAWNESILSAFLLFALFLMKAKKGLYSSIIFGLSLGIKQFSIIFAPYIWKNFTKTEVILSLIVGVITYVPFLLLSPFDLIHDLFLAFNYVRYDSISLIPLLLQPFWSNSTHVPTFIRYFISISQYSVTAYTIFRFINQAVTPQKIASFFSVSFFIFLMLSPISNINYFYLLFPFLCLGGKELKVLIKHNIGVYRRVDSSRGS